MVLLRTLLSFAVWKKVMILQVIQVTSMRSLCQTPAQDQELQPDLELNFGFPGEEAGSDTLDVNNNFTGAFLPIIRKGTPTSANLWPKSDGYPTIAYRIGGTQVSSSAIRQALGHYEERTCVRFQSTFWPFPGHKLRFTGGTGCSSAVGFQTNFWWWLKGQPITLESGCGSQSTLVHEVGHALGMFHEQSRKDRDAHISINYGNIRSDARNNFEKFESKYFDTEYDLSSVLHYGPFAFSDNGRATLVSKDPMAKGLMLINRKGLSHMDEMLVNKLYGCVDLWISRCPGVTADPCKNRGYFGPDCKCVCPDGTTGNLCENKSKSYTQALIDKYLPKNQKFTAPATISSDGARSGDIFTKLFTAPACQRPHLTVQKFGLAPESSRGRCSFQGTEIGLQGPSSGGSVYCDTQLKVGQTLTSSTSSLYVFYWLSVKDSREGFEFKIEFKPASGCSVRNGVEVFSS